MSSMLLTLFFCSAFNFHINFSHTDALSSVLLKIYNNNMDILNINLLKNDYTIGLTIPI